MSSLEPGVLRLCRHRRSPSTGRAIAGSRRGSVSYCWQTIFFLARLAWFYPILLLAAASIDFLVGSDLQRIPRERTTPRLALVSVSVILNVGLLAATKLIPVALGELYRWVFPLSLSFYCFQSMTYTIDLYRGNRPGTRSYLTHLTSASLFTVIVAGPINRISDLIKQLQQPFSLTPTQGGRAFLLIASGLMKKLLIADFLSNNVANRIFDTPTLYSGAEVLIGVYAYALQIYFDFSGYTDIAMGSAYSSASPSPTTSTAPTNPSTSPTSGVAGTSPSPTGCATTSTSPSPTPPAGRAPATSTPSSSFSSAVSGTASAGPSSSGDSSTASASPSSAPSRPSVRRFRATRPDPMGPIPQHLRHLPLRLPHLDLLPLARRRQPPWPSSAASAP